MTPKALTLDCAGTLIAVNWRPERMGIECAVALGVRLDEAQAADLYLRLLQARWPAYQQMNLLRSQEASDRFWEQMTRDWLTAIGADEDLTPALLELADARLYGPDGDVFRPYPDAEPALQALRQAGYRLAVLSNWDVSLHKVLRRYGLDAYLEFAVASLEEGVEKPDPRLFHVALGRLGLSANDVVHVGDDAIDDLQGAKGVGMRAFLIDRSSPSTGGVYIQSLLELPEVLRSLD